MAGTPEMDAGGCVVIFIRGRGFRLTNGSFHGPKDWEYPLIAGGVCSEFHLAPLCPKDSDVVGKAPAANALSFTECGVKNWRGVVFHGRWSLVVAAGDRTRRGVVG